MRYILNLVILYASLCNLVLSINFVDGTTIIFGVFCSDSKLYFYSNHDNRPFYSATLSTTTHKRSRLQHGYCIGVSRRSAQATISEGLAQGPYMAVRAGVELRMKVIDSTKAPPCL